MIEVIFIKIYTASMAVARRHKLDFLDTTVKSGDKRLSPTWDIVMGRKEGTVSDDQYIRTYLSLMRQSYIAHQDWWKDLLSRDKIILVCYCTHGVSFCHRYILAEIFERLGGEIVGEILDPEEPPVPIPRLAASHFEPAIRDRSGNPVIQGKTLAFTGHRPNALGGYDENHPINRWVKSELDVWISHLMSEGFETFISGGALGVDQWAAETVIRHGGRLIVARPFPSQAKQWPKASQDRYEKILSHAAEVVDVSDDPYSPEKMHLRNEWMVDRCHALLAVYNGKPGGTASCVQYARSQGRPIYLIDPTKTPGVV